jgi:hypothetical protein
MWILRGLGLVIAVSVSVSGVEAQQEPGGLLNPQRDCQTVLTCRFGKGGSYRGCLSSYSCRTCSFVTANCKIAGRRAQICQKLRCSWDG